MNDLPAPSVVTLAELFRARMFRIVPASTDPPWTSSHIEAFEEDLAKASSNTPHFLGTLLVVPDGPPQSAGGGLQFHRWAVYDGRHRLMSAVAWAAAAIEGLEAIQDTDGPMLASILRRRYVDVDGSARVEIDGKHHQSFMGLSTDYHRARLANDDASPEDRFTRLIEPVERLEHGLRLLLYPIADEASAHRFIETSDSRGRQV